MLSQLAVASAALLAPAAPVGSAPAARCRKPTPRMMAVEDDAGTIKHEPLLSLSSGPGIDVVESTEEREGLGDPRLRSFDIGPFATTLGVRDGKYNDKSAEPNFLEREDWHVSSTFSEEDIAAAVAEAAALSVVVEEEEEEVVYVNDE